MQEGKHPCTSHPDSKSPTVAVDDYDDDDEDDDAEQDICGLQVHAANLEDTVLEQEGAEVSALEKDCVCMVC